MANPRGKKRRPRRQQVLSITAGYLPRQTAPYDPAAYPDDLLIRDKVASILGGPIGGWNFELVYRFAIFHGLNIDWAIMLNAVKDADGLCAERRRVERIDICHSEVHRHTFRLSSDPDDNLGDRTVIQSISADDAVIVNREYDKQMDFVSREWELRARRWLDG
ncbi:hypothetical protein E3G67_003551 [Mycobacteroides abscessus]|nr:hypothetical protein [Mycobacteroides abscessus]